ncbi:MAG TPA: hypothetical protein VFK57_17640 [Vicinamibacterales bacterium]|nr:hypothetical protein [Vicinamibacterales bacterium]
MLGNQPAAAFVRAARGVHLLAEPLGLPVQRLNQPFDVPALVLLHGTKLGHLIPGVKVSFRFSAARQLITGSAGRAYDRLRSVTMTESLADEHARLRERMRELQAEHARLEATPGDIAAHVAHRAHLHTQIEALRAHIERIKRDAAR